MTGSRSRVHIVSIAVNTSHRTEHKSNRLNCFPGNDGGRPSVSYPDRTLTTPLSVLDYPRNSLWPVPVRPSLRGLRRASALYTFAVSSQVLCDHCYSVISGSQISRPQGQCIVDMSYLVMCVFASTLSLSNSEIENAHLIDRNCERVLTKPLLEVSQ